jgi:hypothetical protein
LRGNAATLPYQECGAAAYCGLLGAAFAVCAGGDFAAAQTSFVAPPRTTADITAILDQEKPDPAKAVKVRDDADATLRR